MSVLVPARNEAQHIAKCLDSIVATNYPADRLEVLVIDGRSTDGTREIVTDYSTRYPFVQCLDNPKVIQAAALNIGLAAARGQVIIRMDAHTTYAPDYIDQCVTLLNTTGAACVGGVQRAVGDGYVPHAIAMAMSSRFGVGDAQFHYSENEMWVDTVYLGAWRKATLESVGGFNEDWVVNEDYELNYRVRKQGGKVLLSPRIRCQYQVRGSLRHLARQYFRYGFWKIKTLYVHPHSLRWRQLAPPAFVVSLALSGVMALFHYKVALIVPMLYLVANAVASARCVLRDRLVYFPILPVVFFTLHFFWGIGFLWGLLRWPFCAR